MVTWSTCAAYFKEFGHFFLFLGKKNRSPSGKTRKDSISQENHDSDQAKYF